MKFEFSLEIYGLADRDECFAVAGAVRDRLGTDPLREDDIGMVGGVFDASVSIVLHGAVAADGSDDIYGVIGEGVHAAWDLARRFLPATATLARHPGGYVPSFSLYDEYDYAEYMHEKDKEKENG